MSVTLAKNDFFGKINIFKKRKKNKSKKNSGSYRDVRTGISKIRIQQTRTRRKKVNRNSRILQHINRLSRGKNRESGSEQIKYKDRNSIDQNRKLTKREIPLSCTFSGRCIFFRPEADGMCFMRYSISFIV